MKKKVIAFFTGNRAEYGLQFPIIKAVNDHPKLDYRLIVSGSHLEKNFGQTLSEIKADGLRIDAELKLKMNGSSLLKTTEAIGAGIIAISKTLAKIRPDYLVVYADRFEGLAAVISASQMNIPTVHIEGGDITQGGALDDSVRHAMTKLSHLHLTTNKNASKNVLSMGEEAWRVHTIGFPPLDYIKDKNFASISEIKKIVKINPKDPIILFTQHPLTTEFEKSKRQFKISIKAIKRLAKHGVQIILTFPNNDAGSKKILEEIKKLQNLKIKKIFIVKSLGRYIYQGILALSKNKKYRIACVGNSSSGIKETPAFGCPTVNIGSRQEGRLRGTNVIDVPHNEKKIFEAAKSCLFNERFRKYCRSTWNPYGGEGVGKKAASILAKNYSKKKLLQKKHFWN